MQVNVINVDSRKIFDEKIQMKRRDSISRISNTALLKFFIPTILSDISKVLYLDGDIVMRKDIVDMYGTCIDEYNLAAVPDEMNFDFERWIVNKKQFRKFYESLLKTNGKYFNSGVMLLNLDRLRL